MFSFESNPSIASDVLVISYEGGIKNIEYLVDDIFSWDFLNKNEEVDSWRFYQIRKGIILVASNGKPDVDWKKYFEVYKELKRLRISHSTKYAVELIPYFYDQSSYEVTFQRIYDDFRLSKKGWEELCKEARDEWFIRVPKERE